MDARAQLHPSVLRPWPPSMQPPPEVQARAASSSNISSSRNGGTAPSGGSSDRPSSDGSSQGNALGATREGEAAAGARAIAETACNSDSGGGGAAGAVGSGSVAGFVAIQVYEAQIQAVAQLHGRVGQLMTQLREAQGDADGTLALLQQERRDAAARGATLRARLEEAATALIELQGDHEALRGAHARLVAKDLAATGLLKDK
jgi:hypothetical protein